jgi:hypothetical protein
MAKFPLTRKGRKNINVEKGITQFIIMNKIVVKGLQ